MAGAVSQSVNLRGDGRVAASFFGVGGVWRGADGGNLKHGLSPRPEDSAGACWNGLERGVRFVRKVLRGIGLAIFARRVTGGFEAETTASVPFSKRPGKLLMLMILGQPDLGVRPRCGATDQ